MKLPFDRVHRAHEKLSAVLLGLYQILESQVDGRVEVHALRGLGADIGEAQRQLRTLIRREEPVHHPSPSDRT